MRPLTSIPHRLALTGLAVTTALVLPGSATAQPSPRESPRPSQFAAAFGVAINNIDVAVDGHAKEPQEDEFSFALEAGYSRAVFGSLAIGALLRGVHFRDQVSLALDEARFRLDLRVGPELRFRPMPKAAWGPELGVALGGGPSLAFVSPPEHRIVVESYGTGTGFNVGGRFYGAFLAQRGHGPYLAADITVFAVSITRHASVPDDPTLDADNLYRFSGQELYLVAGYALTF